MLKGLKKEHLILLVIIAALSVYLLLRPSDHTRYQLPQMEEIDTKALTKIEIKGPKDTLILEKVKKEWLIMPQKYVLAAEISREMMAALKNFKTIALVSEARAYDRYELNDDRKITVKAFAGDVLKRDFEVGKQAPSFKQAFVKLAGDHRVYHSGQNIRPLFGKETDDLRDKSIFGIAATDVTEISVTAKNANINFKRQLSQPKTSDKKDAKKEAKPELAKVTWINPGGPDGDPAKIDKLITALADLKCAQFIYDRKKADFTKPAYSLTVKSPKPHTLNLFSEGVKKDNDIPATSSGQKDAFYIQTWKANEIKEAINGLLGIKPKDEAQESK